MKFNFEKAKEVAMGVGIITASAGAVEAQEQNNTELNKSQTIEVPSEIKEENLDEKTISFEEANKALIKGGNYYEGIKPLKIAQEKQKEVNEENKLLLSRLNELEKGFAKLSKGKYEISKGSISIISGYELSHEIDVSKYKEKDGLERTSPLDNRVITNNLNYFAVNNLDGINILGRDEMTFGSIQESQKMEKGGYINLGGDYKHYIPEYYIVLDQNNDKYRINFQIRVVSSKEKNVIKEIKLSEELPGGDQVLDSKFINILQNKILPKLETEIKGLLTSLKISKDENKTRKI